MRNLSSLIPRLRNYQIYYIYTIYSDSQNLVQYQTMNMLNNLHRRYPPVWFSYIYMLLIEQYNIINTRVECLYNVALYPPSPSFEKREAGVYTRPSIPQKN